MQLLSIVMPVYNEAFYVEQTIRHVLKAPLPDGLERELIIVNDASTDGTREVLERLHSMLEESHRVRLFHQEVNQGKGAAVRRGIDECSGDLILIQDADLEYDPSDYMQLVQPILNGDADAVYGSRYLPAHYRRVLRFWHSHGNRFLTLLSNACTNLDLTDMETCYKLVRARILKSIPLRSKRFGIEPELTAKLAKRGCRIFEVPVSYRGRSYQEGKKITWKDGLKALFVILKYRFVDDIYKDENARENAVHKFSRTHRFHGWLAEKLRPFTGDHVLELGAGIGNFTLRFLPRQSYLATDRDSLHVDYLKNTFAHNQRVSVRELDPENPAHFSDLAQKTDTVLCLSVLEYLQDAGAALKNIYEALQRGGRACILVPRRSRLTPRVSDLSAGRYFSQDELEDLVKSAGFEIERTETFNRASLPMIYLNARVFKRKRLGKLPLKIFDSTVWFWRRADRFLPWQGISILCIARKPASTTAETAH